jgi:hypothetical protein
MICSSVNRGGSVPFSVKEKGDRLSRQSPRHHVLTCLFPSWGEVCSLRVAAYGAGGGTRGLSNLQGGSGAVWM